MTKTATKTLTTISISITMALLVLGCGSNENSIEEEPLKIGVVLYLSNNDYANVAQEFNRGLKLAIADSNIPITLLVEDDQLIPKNTVLSTQKLINIDNVDIMMYSEALQAHAAAPIAQEANIPTFVIWESAPGLTDIGDHVFGIGFWQPSAGQVPARYARETLHANTAAIIYDTNSWSENVVGFFKDEFERTGGTILYEGAVPNEEKDFRSIILKAQLSDADILFAPLGYHPGIFFKQLHEIGGYDGQVLSSDQINQEFIDAAQGGLENVYFPGSDMEQRPPLAVVEAKYEAKYGTAPNDIELVGLAYDAALIATNAWMTKGTNSLRDTIANTKDLPGMFSDITMQGQNFPREETMFVVRNGKPELVN